MSISREDIDNRHIKTLSISVSHVMRYIDTMGKKDKKTILVKRDYKKSIKDGI